MRIDLDLESGILLKPLQFLASVGESCSTVGHPRIGDVIGEQFIPRHVVRLRLQRGDGGGSPELAGAFVQSRSQSRQARYDVHRSVARFCIGLGFDEFETSLKLVGCGPASCN